MTSPGPRSCVERTLADLSADQRAGQLLMIAVHSGDTVTPRVQINDLHIGNVLYLGGWRGPAAEVAAVSARLQAEAGPHATTDVKLLVAADQEGGNVQQLRGPGFSTMPTALVQARMTSAQLRSSARQWGSELRNAGVNVNLAPVSDTVPASLGTGNGPIGRWQRQYSSDPAVVARANTSFIEGMSAAQVRTTVKHFPGIGRIRGNTDTTASGIVDPVTTRDDPYLRPFAAGIRAGAGLVMVSTATYPRIDPNSPAAFSRTVITGMLRGDLGWQGVVITDDVGVAASVQGIAPALRATRFIDAGGDIVLTADASTVAPMVRAIVERSTGDPEFRSRSLAALRRVLTLKDEMGLLPCSN